RVLRPPPSAPLPYTTLFRSLQLRLQGRADGAEQRLRAHGFHEEGRDAHRRDALPGFRIAAAGNDEDGDGGERLDLAQPLQHEKPDRKSTRLNSSHLVISYAV